MAWQTNSTQSEHIITYRVCHTTDKYIKGLKPRCFRDVMPCSLIDMYEYTTWHYNQEDHVLNTYDCENLKISSATQDLHTSVLRPLQVPCCWSRWSPCSEFQEDHRWCGLVPQRQKLSQEWWGLEAYWCHACAVQWVHWEMLCACLPHYHGQYQSVTGNVCAGWQCESMWMGRLNSLELPTCGAMCYSMSCNTKEPCKHINTLNLSVALWTHTRALALLQPCENTNSLTLSVAFSKYKCTHLCSLMKAYKCAYSVWSCYKTCTHTHPLCCLVKIHKLIHPVCNLVKTHTHTLTLLCDAGQVSCLCSPELVGVVS